VPGEAKVAELERAVSGDEHVGWLDVAVHHAPLMHVQRGRQNLHERLPDLLLAERLAALVALLDQRAKVAALCARATPVSEWSCLWVQLMAPHGWGNPGWACEHAHQPCNSPWREPGVGHKRWCEPCPRENIVFRA